MEDYPHLWSERPLLAPEHRSLPGTPTIRLLAAILEDACFCLQPTSLVSRETRADAAAWVRGEVVSAAFCSFREVCDILGLDAAAVRPRLLARAGAPRALPGQSQTTALRPSVTPRGAPGEFTARSRFRHGAVSSVRHT